MTKKARPDHSIHELIAARWSPYGFSDRPVLADDLRSLFEAARWSASSYNEQPWRFIVATKDKPEEHARVLSCLVEANQAWARHAPVLVLAATMQKHARNHKPNRACEHDLGLAVAHLTFEATFRGISVHQMIGILPDRAHALFSIPSEATVLTGLAVGYAQPSASHLDESIRQRDEAPRGRKPLKEFVYAHAWGRASALVTPEQH